MPSLYCSSFATHAWSRQIRALYRQQFQGKCPRTLSNLQTLTFLPKVLEVQVPWTLLEVQTVASNCGVPIVCFAGTRHNLANALATSPSFHQLCQRVLQFRLEKKHDCCTTLRQLTTWNVSGWRTVQWTQPKSRAIHRAARKGIVCLQETRWSDSTAANFLQNYPGFDVSHTPAAVTDNGGLSGGVAILIPCGFRLIREEVILPSKIIAAYVQSRSDSYWVISAYCHPITASADCEVLATWLSNHQDEPAPFFVLGDFNRSNLLAPQIWQQVLDAAHGEDIVNDAETFWGPNGASSLDKVVLPSDYLNRGLIQYKMYLDRLFENSGHAKITVQLQHRPPVTSSSDLPVHMTIPAAVFQPGKDRHDTRQVWPSLQTLVRRLSGITRPTLESLQAMLWQWWLSLPNRPRDYNTLRRHFQSDRPLLNVSRQLLNELLQALPGFHPSLEEFCQSRTTITVPRPFLWKCFDLLDLQTQQQHFITRNREEADRSRGLGTSAPMWQRLRSSCPKTVFYNGPILDGQGSPCHTDRDLSDAMLATRHFWFEPPCQYDPQWAQYLARYKEQSQRWPHVPPPTQSDFAKTILFTNDSAPGPDGIPYAAWRIHPGIASEAMSTHLDDICRAAVPPPCSVQAWIPKAKLGPTADHFRPLGMPSTFERIIDGSIATVLTKAIAPLLHPSQTVLNLFREPQGAVQSIQNTLDHRLPCAVLSLDLSKAFERVNPYWLLQILSACRAPLWVIAYTRHILLFRRCRHKVQGRLLPSRMIVTGVDMGRSFSVLLFCIAMDPILTYLNRIPGMITVQGYVDDTTMAGDTAAGMQWLHDAWTVCKNLKSAGIQIDEHHCWKASGIHAHGSHEGSLTDFPALAWVQSVQGYPTLRQALLQRTGYTSTTIVSRGESFVCLTPREVDQLLAGLYIKRVDLLFLAKCKCSNKCTVLVNHPASQSTLYALECSHWGAHLIEGKSSALGLLLYGRFTRSPHGWVPVDELTGTQSINPKAMNKANQRLALFSTPAHSVVQRSLANNCFILSLNIYQSTYFGFNWNDVNLYQQRSAKLILGRVWLAARYLPHIFRWLRIAPALDPAITLTNACLGYWFRQNGSSAILSPGYSDVEMRQGAVVQQVFRAWVPLLGIDKVGNLLRLVAGQYSRKSHLRFLQQLKLSLYQAIQEHALTYLRSRVSLQLLPGGVSWAWLTSLASLPKAAANGIARFAVLRWAVNEDDDECLRLRTQGDLHAEQPCQWCTVPTRLYPLGLNYSPACEQCCLDHNINATTLNNHNLGGIPPTSFWHLAATSVQGQHRIPGEWPLNDRALPPCIACGQSDNSAHHWARFCIIPILVLNVLHPAEVPWTSLDQAARMSKPGCVISTHILHQFRRLLIEHGGMQHTQPTAPLSLQGWLNRLHDNAIKSIPSRYLPHMPALLLSNGYDLAPTPTPCSIEVTHNEAVTLHSAALPDLFCTAIKPIASGQEIAVLPLGHPWLQLIHPPHMRSTNLAPNATIRAPDLPTANAQCHIVATTNINPGDIVIASEVGNPRQGIIQIVGQFDGSCFHEEQIGGAGYVVYAVEAGHTRVLACRAVCLPNCVDNIEAETIACQYLVEEVADLSQQLLQQRQITPHVIIQGDILPVIKYFQFAGRLRRMDLALPLESIRTTVSRFLPRALFIYLPRVANSIADDLAGQASRFLLSKCQRDGRTALKHTGHTSINPTLPIPLLQIGGFHIQSCEPPWMTRVITLVEQPHIDHGLLRQHLTLSPQHRTLVESYLAPYSTQRPCIQVPYSSRSDDGLGRKYCLTVGGQRLPKEVRLLLFGKTHVEVDLKGSFYELVRRLSLSLLPQYTPLPTIDELRRLLASDPYIGAVGEKCPDTIKRLPLRVINSTIDATYYYLNTIVQGTPGPVTDDVLRRLRAQSQMLTERLLPQVRASHQTQQSDSAFRVFEHFEALIVEDTIRTITAQHPTQSLVWLHDGFLIAPPPPKELLQQVEETVLAKHQVPSGPEWFKVESLGGPYRAYKDRLRTVPHASTLSLSRKKPMQPTQPACRTADIRGGDRHGCPH